MMIQTVSPEILHSVDIDKVLILDVRTPMEHAEKRLRYAHRHIPLDALNPADLFLDGAPKPLYLLCRSGQRSRVAAEKFLAHGYDNIFVIDGGLVACETCGCPMDSYNSDHHPTTKTKAHPLSLERQVRIAAGSCVVIGILLALLINIWFCAIPLFVGLGLVFSGITDRCGMALILTKAPWNKMT